MATVNTEGPSSNQNQFWCCIRTWHKQQQDDLEELLQGLKEDPEETGKLSLLVEKHVKHFQEQCNRRAILAQEDAPFFFSPTCCTTYENSYLWLAGERPSQMIRLVYTLSGCQLNSLPDEALQGEGNVELAYILSPTQHVLLNQLKLKLIAEEDRLSSSMASLNEKIADEPLALLAYNSSHPGEGNEMVDQAIDESAYALVNIIIRADKLRLKALSDIIEILRPLQAVNFLVGNIKLHLSVHEWSNRRENQLRGDNTTGK